MTFHTHSNLILVRSLPVWWTVQFLVLALHLLLSYSSRQQECKYIISLFLIAVPDLTILRNIIFSSFEHDLEINDVGPSKTFLCLQTWSWIELGCPFAHTTYSETENKLHLNLIKIWSPSFLAKIFCQKSRSSQKIADFRHTHLLTLDSLYEAHVTQFQDKNEASSTYPAAYWFS